MPLTPEDVRTATFDKSPLGKRGYDEDQVDDFLDRIEATLRGTDSLRVEDIRAAEFDPGARFGQGYDEKQVDDFMDKVIVQFGTGGRAPVLTPAPVAAPVAAPRPVDPPTVPVPVAEPGDVPLPPAPVGIRGYRPRDVQRLAECVRAARRSPDGPNSADLARMVLQRVEEGEFGYDPYLVESLRTAWVTELRRQDR